MSRGKPVVVRLVLDVLKPNTLPVEMLAENLLQATGVERIQIDILERDIATETTRITLEGMNLDREEIKKLLEESSCSLRSVDGITVEKTGSRGAWGQ
ncbi:MAG: hypothetical protein DRN96_07150 [Thermoproteota archaeon]|nr:MAG: hypothetical protein DRN96_07150 [Candidatus Korarchaeota archaeon]RLG54989.1 MAG: hypothetical protein DRN99_03965 [Candidatus Korarchaeota archaeon]